ncbi:hypothetical protein CO038_01925 [Candidatus Pacearchaeota archaeon CG_4_9_14_0_2_um_filter_39_13]|nr:DUF424 family protein [Candidatus Pacearchaeota archaeon]OIO43138.1 MAG: hypothetical protein AUJ64_03075 [Candidatus Pacearchaeota archaeon CG1_02_39_14]PJC44706.1 MAG: hypothetical protein CO038_01925 [Candidatus Pacearchaeota archaeon CG_4_9_14_0_2_um_filter_39_13]
MICVKLHKSYRSILAVCDSDLIGKKFVEGKRILHAREPFFGRQEITHEEAVDLMREQRAEDSTFNIIGEKSIKAAEEAGIINSGYAVKVQGIPFILVLL